MRREPRRWRTRFGRWAGEVGVERIVLELSTAGQPVTPKAVYNWISGDHAPRPICAQVLVRLSRGRIGLDDVYRHRAVIVRTR